MLYTATSRRAGVKLAAINATRGAGAAESFAAEQAQRVSEAVMYAVAEQNLVFLVGFYFFTFQVFKHLVPDVQELVFLGGVFVTPALQLLHSAGKL